MKIWKQRASILPVSRPKQETHIYQIKILLPLRIQPYNPKSPYRNSISNRNRFQMFAQDTCKGVYRKQPGDPHRSRGKQQLQGVEAFIWIRAKWLRGKASACISAAFGNGNGGGGSNPFDLVNYRRALKRGASPKFVAFRTLAYAPARTPFNGNVAR